MRRLAVYLFVIVAFLLLPTWSSAHPMGNFSINHYARLVATRAGLDLYYVLDMAEIPTLTEKMEFSADPDPAVASAKQNAYLRAKCAELCDREPRTWIRCA